MFSVLKAQGWIESERDLNRLSEDTGIPKDILLKALMTTIGIDARKDIFEASRYSNELKEGFPGFDRMIRGLHDRISSLTQMPENIFYKFNFQIPVAYYLSRRPEALVQNPFPPDVLKYMLVVAYNSTLRSDNYMQRLIGIIKEHVDAGQTGFPIQKTLNYMRYLGVSTELDGESLNRDPILTFSLIQKGNWKPLLMNNRLHIDHIFPRARSDELPAGSEEYVDSIWNKYVVFQGDNIRKTDDLPEEYFTGEKAQLKKDYIIPEDPSMIKKEKFLELISWRRQQIAELFRKNLGIELAIMNEPPPAQNGIATDSDE